jgi:hypothetical protein
MTPQRNHRQPSMKRRLRRGLARLLPDPYIEVLSGSNQETTATGSLMTPSRRRLVTNPDRSELSFCLETFASAPVDPHGMERGAHRQLSTLEWRRVGRRPPSHHAEPFPGLAHNSGRRAPAIDEGGKGEGACQPPPHHAELFPDLPATVGGAHQQAITPRRRRVVGRLHTARSRYRTRLQ